MERSGAIPLRWRTFTPAAGRAPPTGTAGAVFQPGRLVTTIVLSLLLVGAAAMISPPFRRSAPGCWKRNCRAAPRGRIARACSSVSGPHAPKRARYPVKDEFVATSAMNCAPPQCHRGLGEHPASRPPQRNDQAGRGSHRAQREVAGPNDRRAARHEPHPLGKVAVSSSRKPMSAPWLRELLLRCVLPPTPKAYC